MLPAGGSARGKCRYGTKIFRQLSGISSDGGKPHGRKFVHEFSGISILRRMCQNVVAT